jgi:nucleoside-diphosphate-sugar epimerase
MAEILITGSTGFIGKHLIRRLVEMGHGVTSLIRPTSKVTETPSVTCHVYKGTYANIESLFQKQYFDTVIHLASMAQYDCSPEQIAPMIETNITLGTFLLQAMKQYGCSRFINTSTYWQHYRGEKTYQPICLYAATKKAFEDIIDFYTLDGTIRAISLTLYDVYGYDDHRNKLLNLLIKNRDAEKSFDLSPGEQKLQMTFIDDVVDAYLQAMNLLPNTPKNHTIYGIYGQETYTLKDIVALLETLIGAPFSIQWGQKAYYPFQIMDPYFGGRLPHWEAKISLKEGLTTILEKEKAS